MRTLKVYSPLFVIWTSWHYVGSSWSLLEGSREAGGLPAVFLLKTCIPVMAGLVLLQGISAILHSIIQLRSAGKQIDNEASGHG